MIFKKILLIINTTEKKDRNHIYTYLCLIALNNLLNNKIFAIIIAKLWNSIKIWLKWKKKSTVQEVQTEVIFFSHHFTDVTSNQNVFQSVYQNELFGSGKASVYEALKFSNAAQNKHLKDPCPAAGHKIDTKQFCKLKLTK